jgi:chemotaxis signal transduction protein
MLALIIPVSTEFYAVPMASVRQVLRRTDVTPIPLSGAELLGAINVRGEVLPILDTGILTGNGPVKTVPYTVLITTEKDLVGLAAESMPIAAELGEPVAAGTRPGEKGVYSSGGRLVVLLDLEELVANHLSTSRER